MGVPVYRDPAPIATEAPARKDASTNAHRRRTPARPRTARRGLEGRRASATPTDWPSSRVAAVVEAEADQAFAAAVNRHRLENGRATLRDALSYEQSEHLSDRALLYWQSERIGTLLQEPTLNADSADYVTTRSSLSLTPPSPPLPSTGLPGDGHTGDLHSGSILHTLSGDQARLTRRFAPALGFFESVSNSDRSALLPVTHPGRMLDTSAPSSRRRSPTGAAPRGDPSRSQSALSRQDPRDGVADAMVNGLGDRVRSPSPEDWETLLTTITPDNNLPSAESSFASSSASASASASSTRLSQPSQAPSTMTSITDISPDEEAEADDGVNIPPYCDIPTSDLSDNVSMSDTDADADAAERLVRDYDRALARLYATDPSILVRMGGREMAPIRAERGERSGSSRTERPGHRQRARPRTTAPHGHSNDRHHPITRRRRRHPRNILGRVRTILDTLARRDDIPDEWWSAVGLSRELTARTDVEGEAETDRGRGADTLE